MGTTMVQFSLATPQNINEAKTQAIENQLPYVDQGDWVENLKRVYGIPSTQSLILLTKTDQNSNEQTSTMMIYDQNGNNLDLSKLVGNNTIPRVPVDRKINSTTSTKAKEYSHYGIDLLMKPHRFIMTVVL
jgi:hypothetical protein